MANTKTIADKYSKEPSKRYKGKLKWLDKLGIGYIVIADEISDEVFVSPSSFLPSDDGFPTAIEGDRVEFNIEVNDSIPYLKAINVEPIRVLCYNCSRFGHFAKNCPNRVKSRVRCYVCRRRVGHVARNCPLLLYGWSSYAPNNGVSSPRISRSKANSANLVEEEEEDDDDDCKIVRPIVCVKKGDDVKKVEEVEDCFILEFDPTESIKFSDLSIRENSGFSADDEEDVSILAEKGQVACRDYPHPRHLCATHPFKETPHHIHCKLCYCYICDIPAPCNEWATELAFSRHCDATTDIRMWRLLRKLKKKKGAVNYHER